MNVKSKVEKKYVPLSICGNCGKDGGHETEKVIIGDHANMLCRVCRLALDDELDAVASKYLDKS
jgi:hypothetical protein